MLVRTERTVGKADPTVTITWRFTLGRLSIRVTEFFGDITSVGEWKAKQLWFSSVFVHKHWNYLAERVFLLLELQHLKRHKENLKERLEYYKDYDGQ